MTTTEAGVQLLTVELFDAVAAAAASSPRRRMNHNFHASADDNPHRMLNVLLRGTYVRPHRHVTPRKSEAFLPLIGSVGIVCFDGNGSVGGGFTPAAGGPPFGPPPGPGALAPGGP